MQRPCCILCNLERWSKKRKSNSTINRIICTNIILSPPRLRITATYSVFSFNNILILVRLLLLINCPQPFLFLIWYIYLTNYAAWCARPNFCYFAASKIRIWIVVMRSHAYICNNVNIWPINCLLNVEFVIIQFMLRYENQRLYHVLCCVF